MHTPAQDVAAGTELLVPGAQGVHEVLAVVSVYVPALQAVIRGVEKIGV